jgi:hypothetical protein
VGKFLTFGDIIAAIPRIDDPDAVADLNWDPALRAAMEMCRPPNWHGTGAGHDLLAIAQDEGIPLSWAPPGEIIRRLRATKSAADREDVLLEERETILTACAATIDDCSAPEIADSRVLIGKAVAAVAAGHDEAGMALAVSVGEGLAHWAVEPRVKAFSSSSEHDQWRAQWEDKRRSKYRRVDLVAQPAKDVEPWDFIHQVLIAPIGHFFTNFRPGDPEPTVMSRHVVAHSPSTAHLTPLNALKAVMLVAGILRSQQDWVEDVRDHEI